MDNRNQRPSLLDPKATGGISAQKGIIFQDNYVMASIPSWMAMDGFTSFSQEASGDVEVKFFVPSRLGYEFHLAEVKDHQLTNREFKRILSRFQHLYSMGEHTRFVIVCAGLTDWLRPVANGLRRIQQLDGFYPQEPIMRDAVQDIIKRGKKIGIEEDTVRFLVEHVEIQEDFQATNDDGDGKFRLQWSKHFPECSGISVGVLGNIVNGLRSLISTNKAREITRKEIEDIVHHAVDQNNYELFLRPVDFNIINADIQTATTSKGLPFMWQEFFGGTNRIFPAPQEWTRLHDELEATLGWMSQCRTSKEIRVPKQRLSVSFAIGAVFSSVSGYSVSVIHNGNEWKTNDHPSKNTPGYDFQCHETHGTNDQLIVSIGIIHDIKSEVEEALDQLKVAHMSALHFHGKGAFTSAKQANQAIQKVKQSIRHKLSEIEGRCLHLFLAGPAFFALFLGHYLNAVGSTVQLHERQKVNTYVPTCTIQF
jgi:hypothetical protein